MQDDRERKRRERPKAVARRGGMTHADMFGLFTITIAVWLALLVVAAGLQRMAALQNQEAVQAILAGESMSPAAAPTPPGLREPLAAARLAQGHAFSLVR
ncbi:MAG TPA: hypothetical protein VME92_12405 [Acetobacteraceae bacterium]|nr:hypothetical protein [Acetobacteraceae bacterium]